MTKKHITDTARCLCCLAALWLAAAVPAAGQWSQQTACPGWFNPTTFVTGNADYYYSGNHGQREQGLPNEANSITRIHHNTSGLAATALAGSTFTSLHYDGNLPQQSNRFVIMTDTLGRDPNTGGALPYVPTHLDNNSLGYASHHTSSIRIGAAPQYEMFNAATLEYTFTVTPDNAIFSLLYALVMQDPVHGDDANPLFIVRLLRQNASGQWVQISDTMANYLVINSNNIVLAPDSATRGWHEYSPNAYFRIYYSDWARYTLDLSRHLNESLRIQVSVAGCSYGAHWAYAYIAGDCRPARLATESACGSLPEVLAPEGLTAYRWLASQMGDVAQPYAVGMPLRELAPASYAPRHAMTEDDFRVVRRVTPSGDTVAIDSVGTCQVVCCELTTALHPIKPYTTRHYISVCHSTLHQNAMAVPDCDGMVTLQNLSTITGENDSVLHSLTRWTLYDNANFSATPFATLTGSPVVTPIAGHSIVGVRMTTFTTDGNDTCPTDTLLTVHPFERPTVTIEGEIHVERDSLCNLTASSDTPGSVFQWSTAYGTIAGGLPSGTQLRVLPYADIATYYVRVTGPNGCTAWDSITLYRFSAESREMASRLFNAIGIDSVACLSDIIPVSIGSAPTNNVVVNNNTVSLSHPDIAFLPDGENCNGNCTYASPVTFNAFADGATVTSANDIKFVRLNIEHSFLGDLYIGITCPNGQKADILRFSNYSSNPSLLSPCLDDIPTASRGWAAPSSSNHDHAYLGMPNTAYNEYDNCSPTAANNGPGTGWNYCWSDNSDEGYTYAADGGYVYRSANQRYLTTVGTNAYYSVDSSDVLAGTHFYHPDQSFANLVGCPLNGQWSIEVMDGVKRDNGYIFDWELSLKASTVEPVHITSTLMLGHNVERTSDSTYLLSAPAATGDTTVSYMILLFDSIGLLADTTVSIHYVGPRHQSESLHACQGEVLNVGGIGYTSNAHFVDTTLSAIGCPVYTEWDLQFHPTYALFDTALLCANESPVYNGVHYDRSGDYRFDYRSIHGCDSTVYLSLNIVDSTFHVAFEISDDGTHWSRDTMLAGCRPYEVMLHNTSTFSVTAQWLTGDGATPQGDSVGHTYDSAGVFDIALVCTSPNGCRDTARLGQAVWVFAPSRSDFTWSPEYPVMSHPDIELHADASDEEQDYMWLFLNADGATIDTLYDSLATYSWTTDDGQLVEGDFEVTLTTIKPFVGPYGDTLVCTDTTQHTISIVSDWLQFPNLVTPNGDGTNDHWEVVNLIECGQYSMNELWIYDRWGHEVYHARDIRRVEDFWYPDRDHCPDGTYYYRFSAKSQYGIVKRNGAIEVVR